MLKELERKVLSTCKKFRLFPKNASVIVALSGGPDSVVLLHLLLTLKEELSLSSVKAVHVNHQLRGEESERDERFVRELCSQLGVELFVERVQVKPKGGESLEACARRLRYAVFEKVLKESGADRVALGHTASDLLETVLLNLTKGAGLKGLRGFLPRRGPFVRPLFEASREDVIAYLTERRLPCVIDSSNLLTDYHRNLLRHKVVPVLKSINRKVEEAVLRSCQTLRLLEDFVSSQLKPLLDKYLKEGRFSAPVKELSELHPYLLRELLIEAYRRLTGGALSAKKVEQLCSLLEKEGFKRLSLGRGVLAVLTQGRLELLPQERLESESFFHSVAKLPAQVDTPAGKLKFFLNKGEPIVGVQEFKEHGIIVRSRKPGDRLKLGGLTKPLKKFLSERKVPAYERDRLPLVEVGGEVVYLPGLFKRRWEGEGEFVGVEFEPKAESSHT